MSQYLRGGIYSRYRKQNGLEVFRGAHYHGEATGYDLACDIGFDGSHDAMANEYATS